MVDLDSDPTKLIEIVEIGKQLLITRGALTTFSIANDNRKVFRDHPCDVRCDVSPGLDLLNIMRLHSPQSAIPLRRSSSTRSIIVMLIPAGPAWCSLQPRAVRPKLVEAANLYVYGLGGIIAPFHRHQADRPLSSNSYRECEK